MANLAYQVTGFAYQGTAVRAYQGSIDGSSGGYVREEIFVDFGTLAERRQQADEIVEKLAIRQSQDISYDDRERQRQLDLELRLSGMEWDNRLLEKMNARRAQLIEEKIRMRLLDIENEQETVLLLLMASQ